jgi:branched-chain amino acid transport system ATP-binding protein
MGALLEIKNLSVWRGRAQTLFRVSLSLEEGKISALLGANGAGKTTLLSAVSRVLDAKEGSVFFDGKDITLARPETLPAMGLVHCPEGRRIFPGMTVLENLLLGAYTVRDKKKNAEALERAFAYFPLLRDRQKQPAGAMSGGEQQMLALARALMSFPRLMMLDEPSLGLAPLMAERIFDIITRINTEEKVTLLLVEQNAAEALRRSSAAFVMENGSVTMSGPSAEFLGNPKIIEAYLGS